MIEIDSWFASLPHGGAFQACGPSYLEVLAPFHTHFFFSLEHFDYSWCIGFGSKSSVIIGDNSSCDGVWVNFHCVIDWL